MIAPQPTFISTACLASRVGRNRAVIDRLMRHSMIQADAFLEVAGARQPLFSPNRALDVLRNLDTSAGARRSPAIVTS